MELERKYDWREMGEIGDVFWFIAVVIGTLILGAGIAFAMLQWQKHHRYPATGRAQETAVDRLYRHTRLRSSAKEHHRVGPGAAARADGVAPLRQIRRLRGWKAPCCKIGSRAISQRTMNRAQFTPLPIVRHESSREPTAASLALDCPRIGLRVALHRQFDDGMK